MATIFEAPAAHEWESPEWEQPESPEWESPEGEWESNEWEGATEWEGEWESSTEWEGEWEGSTEWESNEWESSTEWEGEEEWEGEWEADRFSFGGFLKKIGNAAKKLAPGVVRSLAGMIPGVGGIAGPLLGNLTQSLVNEAESMVAEMETAAFGGNQGEAEVGPSELSHEAALSELLASQAAAAPSEAEAASTISATLPITITIMRAKRAVRPVVPVLTQANARLARSMLRRGPEGRHLLRTIPSINRVAVGTMRAAARRGVPVTAPLAVRSMAAATRNVLGNPRRAAMIVERNMNIRKHTAPPHPRRPVVYQPIRSAAPHLRTAPYHPQRVMHRG
jgi:hypothetical protein